MNQFELHQGDCLEALRGMADNSVDSIVTDPPYGLSFMGKRWDYDVPSQAIWEECLRVLKPGGHLLAFAGTRTQHRMAVRIEDAGFEIRDMIAWVYGSGFPKSMNVSKAVDGHLTSGRSDSLALREVNETRPGEASIRGQSQNGHAGFVGSGNVGPSVKRDTPATEAGEQWQGWGTALKPALEPITVARKPLIGTVAANVLEHGTGAINIDGCRVPSGPDHAAKCASVVGLSSPRNINTFGMDARAREDSYNEAGRFPANIIHDGSDEVVALFPDSNGAGGSVPKTRCVGYGDGIGNGMSFYTPGERTKVNSGSGSAARFFYCAKASRADRNEGVGSSSTPAVSTGATMREREDADWSKRNGNHHPTVKPTDLMAYLCRLVTPPGGVVLDPFMGSGSTGKACMREGFRFIGCELDPKYIAIARARIQHELSKRVAAEAAASGVPHQADLFGAVA